MTTRRDGRTKPGQGGHVPVQGPKKGLGGRAKGWSGSQRVGLAGRRHCPSPCPPRALPGGSGQSFKSEWTESRPADECDA
eukprot:CAMPEP_0174374358 /NCGR_PEP_ID=MMETSP0811_2-20130205/110609_1 /TAXON_ID=73025 ORGANISM="Eutreptiella gymnastica-like, Strain CCMP1594" /NCGR_SAMPLE_ID=MMETSP0811_2 /ASSEMBLY_ACC=CAM_ASM_000667 /LENGTH=79 /DNA_ID=CAMNT_0015523605 /DNA_START=162 /DNA_END=401 /DNA_ORIENTATION=+